MASEPDICGCILLIFALLSLAYLAANTTGENNCQATNCTKKLIRPCINKILKERNNDG